MPKSNVQPIRPAESVGDISPRSVATDLLRAQSIVRIVAGRLADGTTDSTVQVDCEYALAAAVALLDTCYDRFNCLTADRVAS